QSTVSRPVYVDDTSGPTARIVSPTIATAPGRCSVNRSSIVSTMALVRRRSQVCTVLFEDRSIVRHAAWGSRLQAREHPLTPINGETAEQGIHCVFGELCIDRLDPGQHPATRSGGAERRPGVRQHTRCDHRSSAVEYSGKCD